MEDENDVYEPGGADVPEPETSRAAEVGHLGAGQAGFGQPDAGQADEDQLYVGQPASGELDAGQFDAAEFDAVESGAGEFDAAESGAGEFDAAESGAGQFDAAEPDQGQSEAAPAASDQPDADQREDMREIRLSVPRPETGEARVDAALSMLDDLTELPVTDHPAVFEHMHAQLSEVLGELGGGQLTGRDG